MNDPLVFLNGEVLPISQAKVSVLDRGFIFGDGVYDVVPVYGQRLFRFDEHIARLNRSLAKLRIASPAARDEWLSRCRQLVAATAQATGAEDQVVYIQVTRGVAPRDHVMPANIKPTVFMMANPMKPPSNATAVPPRNAATMPSRRSRAPRWPPGSSAPTTDCRPASSSLPPCRSSRPAAARRSWTLRPLRHQPRRASHRSSRLRQAPREPPAPVQWKGEPVRSPPHAPASRRPWTSFMSRRRRWMTPACRPRAASRCGATFRNCVSASKPRRNNTPRGVLT